MLRDANLMLENDSYLSIDDDDARSEEDLKMIIARRFNFISVGNYAN